MGYNIDDKEKQNKNNIRLKDKIITFFLNYEENTGNFFKKYYPQIITIIAFMFIYGITSDISRIHYQGITQESEIASILSEEDEELVQVVEGDLIELSESTYQEFLIHGTESTYLFYYSDNGDTPPLVYSIEDKKWLGNEPQIPFSIFKAFSQLGLGEPNKYDKGVVFTDSDEYNVMVSPYKIDVSDIGSYTLSPILPARVQDFLKDYTNEEIDDLEIINIYRMKDYELIYLQGKEKVYQLRSYFDESAQASEIVGNIDSITPKK